MADIIETTLDTRKIECGVMKIQKKKTNFMRLVWHSTIILTRRPPRKPCSSPLTSAAGRRSGATGGSCHRQGADTARVDNLIKNAVEAAPSGTAVMVNVKESPDAVVFSVNNSGDPIPPDVQANVSPLQYLR